MRLAKVELSDELQPSVEYIWEERDLAETGLVLGSVLEAPAGVEGPPTSHLGCLLGVFTGVEDDPWLRVVSGV